MHKKREDSRHRPILADWTFISLWIGTTASGLATWALPFVLGLAIIEDTITAGQLGAALAARTVGFLAALPLAGVLADRHSPRLVVAVSAAAVASASLPLAWSLGRSSFVLMAAAVIVGAGQGACRPAFQALIPLAVDQERRQSANAAITVAVRASVLAGPAVTGVASTIIGTTWLMVATGLLWVVAATVPPWLRCQPTTLSTATSSKNTILREFRDGVDEARRHPWFLAGLGALATVIMTGYSVTAVALPIVSRDQSGSGTLLAAAATAYTLGALLGGLIIARWRPPSIGWVALASLGAYAVVPAALALSAPIPVIIAAYLSVGLGIEFFNVPWFTATQREVPPERLSRVSSIDFLVSYGLAPLGLALIAPAIDTFGLQPTLLACSIACAIGPITAAMTPSSRHFARKASFGFHN